MVDGLLNLSLWGYIAAALLLTHITIVSVTVFLHRHQAHRALDLHPAVSHFFRFWLWLTSGMVTREWVAVHRKHHAKCEQPEDPHSPKIFGIRKVFWEGAELYRIEAANKETLEKYSRGTPDDWLERNLYGRYSGKGPVAMLIIDLALFGVAGLSIWAVQMLWIPLFAAGVINGIGHWWGYRSYECTDAATNIVPWGILIGGEELHNNHHAFPASARLSSKWWEFDAGWFYIRSLELMGLAHVKKVAPMPVVVQGKEEVDLDTVQAIILNRMHVMARYGKDVLQAVLKQEFATVDNAGDLRQTRRLLLREATLLDENARSTLHNVLKRSDALDTAYQFRLRLQNIWNRSAASHEHLLHALQEWCAQAEVSGIKALREFALGLRGYSMRLA